MFLQILSLVGATLILAAYILSQRGVLGRADRVYNLVNLVGALLLAWVAVDDGRLGFIVLETVWALASIPPLLRPAAR